VKLRSVQTLRAVAALAVVSVHAGLGELGTAGVDLFFVISGFIIGKVMVGRSAVEFARDRLWRIYPIYWVALLPWIYFHAIAFGLDPVRIFASVTLWPIIGEFYTPYLAVGWTLCFEMLFYGGATLAIVTGRGREIILCALALVTAGLLVTNPLLNFVGSPMILEFLFGLAIAKVRPRWQWGVPLAAVALLVWAASPAADLATPPVGPSQWTVLLRVMWWGLPAAALVYGALSLEKFARHRSLDFAVAVGDSSYSLYLVHVLAMVMSGMLGLAGIIAATLAGLALHRYVEKPLLALAPWNRRKSSEAARTQDASAHALPAPSILGP
jgi:exopolysaccharide production protein ExoZ